jgi:hypothetical protein
MNERTTPKEYLIAELMKQGCKSVQPLIDSAPELNNTFTDWRKERTACNTAIRHFVQMSSGSYEVRYWLLETGPLDEWKEAIRKKVIPYIRARSLL